MPPAVTEGSTGSSSSPMAVWKYAALSQNDGEQSSTGGLPETVPGMSSAPSSSYVEDDVALKRRMPFCIGL